MAPHMKHVFKDRHTPLYSQVATLLRHRISSAIWKKGEQLPVIEALMQEFSVARTTVRQALALLEDEGLIQRSRGKGTFVTNTPDQPSWLTLDTSWTSFLRSLEGNWSKLVEVRNEVSHPDLDVGLGVPAPSYRMISRVHGSGDRAYADMCIHLDQRCYQLAPKRFEAEFIIPVMESLPEIEIATAKQVLTIGVADFDIAERLEIAVNSPVGMLRRVLCDKDGTAIYIGDITYRGDLVRLEMNLNR